MKKELLILTLVTLSIPALQSLPARADSASNGEAQLPAVADLELASVHAVIAELDNGERLYSKHADKAVPIASLTKLMTALVVLESGQPLDAWVPIVERHEQPAKNAYSRIRIGSEAKRRDLLQITLMSSENLAAYVLARAHPGGFDGFVAAMNDKAAELGMTQTRFVGPSGLSPENRASASDLVKLVEAAYAHETIRELSTGRQHSVQFRNPRYSLSYGNTNALARNGAWRLALSKTGYLREAGRCLVLVTEIEDRTVAMVLLDAFGRRTPLGDAGRVRRWLETGSGGAIAGPAREYEQRATAAFEEASAEEPEER